MKKRQSKKLNKFLASVKQGFVDMKTVAQEGTFKLFLKPAIVVILLILGYRWAMGKMDQQVKTIKTKMDAIAAQQASEKEYLSNKKKLLDLEPRFPDMSSKSDWLLRQVVSLFQDTKITPKMASSQSENTSNSNYVITSIPVEINASYDDLGKLMANIENKDEFLKVSEFSIVKNNENLGMNAIKMQINAVFPKEKVAKSLFKDNGGKQ